MSPSSPFSTWEPLPASPVLTSETYESEATAGNQENGVTLARELAGDGIEISHDPMDENVSGWGPAKYIKSQESLYTTEQIEQMKAELTQDGVTVSPAELFYRDGDSDFDKTPENPNS